MKYFYTTEDEPFEEDELCYAIEFESDWTEEDGALDFVANAAAEKHYHDQDGCGSDWPMIFNIFNTDKKFLGKFLVEMDYEPVFSAEKGE